MVRQPLLFETRIIEDRQRVATILNNSWRSETTMALTWLLGQLMWQTNGNITSHKSTISIGHKCGIHVNHANEQPSCGSFGKRKSWSMNGGVVLPWCLSPSNASFAFHTLLNQSNIINMIALRLGEPSNGPLLSCMNFVGWGWGKLSLETKPSLAKGDPRSLLK